MLCGPDGGADAPDVAVHDAAGQGVQEVGADDQHQEHIKGHKELH